MFLPDKIPDCEGVDAIISLSSLNAKPTPPDGNGPAQVPLVDEDACELATDRRRRTGHVTFLFEFREFFESGNCCVESGWGSRETDGDGRLRFSISTGAQGVTHPDPPTAILPSSREESRDPGHRGAPSLSDSEFVGISQFYVWWQSSSVDRR